MSIPICTKTNQILVRNWQIYIAHSLTHNELLSGVTEVQLETIQYKPIDANQIFSIVDNDNGLTKEN